jgi:hypothetical protein
MASSPQSTVIDDLEKQSRVDEDGGTIEPASEDSAVESELVDFDGPDDPANPYNWSKSKKWSHGGVLSVMSFIT